jgi:hypothetical protein
VAKEEDELATLYQAPLGEFTPARNALAKAAGAAGAEIRALEKPSAPAWAVNQLYWHRRATYDTVVRAAIAMRDAHAQFLSGRGGDVPAAEAAHRDAMRTATQEIRSLLEAGGESTSAATFEAIAETLQALPSDQTPGRLTRALKPLGFGALLAMGIAPSVQKSGGPGVLGSSKKDAAELAARKKALEKQLRAAEVAERAAEATASEARKALANVERDYAATRDKLQFLEKQRSDAAQDVHRTATVLREAGNVRAQASQDLAKLS